MSSSLLQAEALGRRYGTTVALESIDLEVAEGSIVGLLGPNGAGKSTLIHLATGLRRPTSGAIRLFGGSPRDPGRRAALGVTPQQTGLPETLRVSEVVDFVARHYPDPMPTGEVLERFALEGCGRRQAGGLSGGQQRRLAVALAFVGRPRLVVLDEPTSGMDVESRRSLWAGVRDYRDGGGTVLLTSHYLEEVEALATRVVVIAAGRVRADGAIDEVRATVATSRVRMRADTVPPLPPGTTARREGEYVVLRTSDADEVVRVLVRSGVAFRDLEVTRGSLEDAFLSLTDRPAPDDAPSPSAPR